MERKMKSAIYGGGGLFDIAYLHHNLVLEKHLFDLGYDVTLPQREAGKFIESGKLNLLGICLNCANQAATHRIVLLNLDGPDADSGTAFEGGIAAYLKVIEQRSIKEGRPITIGYRTDIRTDISKELGINGMLSQLLDKIVYCPAYGINSFEDVNQFYKTLAGEIDKAIKELIGR